MSCACRAAENSTDFVVHATGYSGFESTRLRAAYGVLATNRARESRGRHGPRGSSQHGRAAIAGRHLSAFERKHTAVPRYEKEASLPSWFSLVVGMRMRVVVTAAAALGCSLQTWQTAGAQQHGGEGQHGGQINAHGSNADQFNRTQEDQNEVQDRSEVGRSGRRRPGSSNSSRGYPNGRSDDGRGPAPPVGAVFSAGTALPPGCEGDGLRTAIAWPDDKFHPTCCLLPSCLVEQADGSQTRVPGAKCYPRTAPGPAGATRCTPVWCAPQGDPSQPESYSRETGCIGLAERKGPGDRDPFWGLTFLGVILVFFCVGVVTCCVEARRFVLRCTKSAKAHCGLSRAQGNLPILVSTRSPHDVLNTRPQPAQKRRRRTPTAPQTSCTVWS